MRLQISIGGWTAINKNRQPEKMNIPRIKFRKNPPKEETVVLLHGMLRKGGSMRPVEYYLRNEGYDIVNITYPYNKLTLQELTDYLHSQLQLSSHFNNASKVHFVTHSMGGLVTRYYLSKHKPAHLGRVVMLGPPNKGSEFADFVMERKNLRRVFERVYGPAGKQLRTGERHADNEIGIDYEIGVIAGSRSVNPLAPYVLDGENDGYVPVESTKIDGMKDHIVMKTTHSFMMYSPSVLRQIRYFLKYARFYRKPGAAPG